MSRASRVQETAIDTQRLPAADLRVGQFDLDHVMQEDCVQAMSRLPNASFDIAIADPPYNLSQGEHWQWDSSAKLPGFGGDWNKVMESWDSMSLRDYFLFTLRWLGELKRGGRAPGAAVDQGLCKERVFTVQVDGLRPRRASAPKGRLRQSPRPPDEAFGFQENRLDGAKERTGERGEGRFEVPVEVPRPYFARSAATSEVCPT
ncbi:MAG: hypothetical protein QME60_07875 [Verrucomicrobiota bacterium]|nr:hypothetical protein [Verrucomicrobiota bacterium]